MGTSGRLPSKAAWYESKGVHLASVRSEKGLELTTIASEVGALFSREMMQANRNVNFCGGHSISIPTFPYVTIFYDEMGRNQLSLSDFVTTSGQSKIGAFAWKDDGVEPTVGEDAVGLLVSFF